MRYTQIGSDRASVIGLGTWQYGAREWGWRPERRGEAIRIIRRALELGINLIDTAEIYGFGESERIVGEALECCRERVFLASKVFPLWPTQQRIRRAALRSLERLRTPYIDLYQVHFPNPLIPLTAQMGALRRLQAEGSIRHVGVSNFRLSGWRRAEQALRGIGFGPTNSRAGCPCHGLVVSNQVQYHLLKRSAERMLPWARAGGRVIVAYSPLAQGLLSGQTISSRSRAGARRFNPFFTPANLAAAAPVFAALGDIAAAHGATPAQIALAWLVHHPGVIAIPGARTVAQLEENAAAADIELSEYEFARLNVVSAAFRPSRLRTVAQLLGARKRGQEP